MNTKHEEGYPGVLTNSTFIFAPAELEAVKNYDGDKEEIDVQCRAAQPSKAEVHEATRVSRRENHHIEILPKYFETD